MLTNHSSATRYPALQDAAVQRLAFSLLAVVTVGAVGFFVLRPAEPVPVPSVQAEQSEATITVHVSGAVAAPGLVEVAGSARVADVIAAAGGTTAQASLTAINLAAVVHDGEQVVVPETRGARTSAPDDGLIHLNRASESELEAIPGVGPVLAGRIIASRDERGGFSTVEDLLDVSGIGEAMLASIRDLVVVP